MATTSTGDFVQTERTTPNRAKERLAYDRDTAYEVLDEALFCDVAFTGPDGAPRILPTFHARVDDTLYLHGSTGSSVGLGGREGFEVSVSATIVDGLIYAKSWMHHSINYRSVVAHGRAVLVTDPDERWTAMKAIVDRTAQGRSERSREPNPKEDAATAVMALKLEEVSVKQRSGGPNDDPADADGPYDNGVAEVRTVVTGRL